VLQSDYGHLVDPAAGPVTTLSHTALVTVAAELGVVGLAAVAALLACLGWTLVKVRSCGSPELGAWAAGMGVAIAAIVLSSQSAGRFLEDPYLWLFLVLAAVLLNAARSIEKVPVESHATLLPR
jgi:hypothetical protein